MREIDLHVHSNHSDGTFSPTYIVEEAAKMGLRAIALTDHDNAGGCEEALEAGKKFGVEVVPGIEISTKYGVAVHILGYFVDFNSDFFLMISDWIVDDRNERNRKMCSLMQADGIDISYEKMLERFGDVIGRPHFARILMEQGYAESINDAFDKYVEKGRKYYVPRTILPIERAMKTIVRSGGLPVLAHPFQYRKTDKELRELIEYIIPLGLKGMECRYSGYNAEQIAYLESLADEYGLVKTGGSDYHGDNKPNQLGRGFGELEVPYEWLEKLKALKNNNS